MKFFKIFLGMAFASLLTNSSHSLYQKMQKTRKTLNHKEKSDELLFDDDFFRIAPSIKNFHLFEQELLKPEKKTHYVGPKKHKAKIHVKEHTKPKTKDLGFKKKKARKLPNQPKNPEEPSESKIKDDSEKNSACRLNLIEAFGIATKTDIKPASSPGGANAFCFRNKVTCCTEEEIEATKKTFKIGKKKFSENIDKLEELFNLFQGKLHKQALFRLKKRGNCMQKTGQMGKSKDAIEFFSTENIETQTNEIYSILQGLNMFKKLQIWFFGNLICTVCSPKESAYFLLNSEKPVFKVDMRTCSDILSSLSFEIRVRKIMRNFLVPLAEFVSCDEENGGVLAKDIWIPDEGLKNFEQLVSDCTNNFDPENQNCQKACAKSVSEYDFSGQIFQNVAKILKILFKEFVKIEIEEYYTTGKKAVWIESEDTKSEFFDSQNSAFKSLGLEKIELVFGNEGAHVYDNIMNKKYFRQSGAEILGLRMAMLCLAAVIFLGKFK